MRIFVRVPPGGASNDSEVVDNGNFQRFLWLLLQKLHAYIEIRPELLCDVQSLAGL